MEPFIFTHLLKTARGETPADLVLKNARIINVFSGDICEGDIAISDKYIVGIGSYKGIKEENLNGKFVCPSFIDAHVHVESSFLSPVEFARVVSGYGTSVVVCDPHEIANVMGIRGVELFIEISKGVDVDFYFMAPSCVPATSLETSGGRIDEKDVELLFKKYPDRVLGLGEVMNFPGTYMGKEDVVRKLVLSENKIIDGHAPLLIGKNLNAYIFAGPMSDHECTDKSEAIEKLKKGMFIFIREGTTEKNLKELIPIVNKENLFRFCFVTDDKHADELYKEGHINFMIKKAIDLGLDPISAIRVATINPASYFRLKRHGAIAPGYYADLVILKDLKDFSIDRVILKGKEVMDENEKTCDISVNRNLLNFDPLTEERLKVVSKGERIRVIEIVQAQILTEERIEKSCVEDGMLISDVNRDLIKVAVVERHKNTGNIGIGFVKGFQLKSGSIASTVAHDSHNLIIAGTNDKDMVIAGNLLREKGGGLIAVKDGEVIGFLDLPLAGLMSLDRIEVVVEKLKGLTKAVAELTPLGSKAFMYLSFLSLPVIPRLRITDMGLIDVEAQRRISLFVS